MNWLIGYLIIWIILMIELYFKPRVDLDLDNEILFLWYGLKDKRKYIKITL